MWDDFVRFFDDTLRSERVVPRDDTRVREAPSRAPRATSARVPPVRGVRPAKPKGSS